MLRYAIVACVALMLIGCGGGGGGGAANPITDDPAISPPADDAVPPADNLPPPENPPSDPTTPPPNTSQVILGGSRDVSGPASTMAMNLPSNQGDVALVQLSATGTGAAARTAIACLRTESRTYSVMPVQADGQPRFFVQSLNTGEPVVFELFNKASMEGELYATPVTLNYIIEAAPLSDPTEATNNQLNTAPSKDFTVPLVGSFYAQRGRTGDMADFYRYTFDLTKVYELSFTNTNDQASAWRYSLEIVNNCWEQVARSTDITAATPTLMSFVPKPGSYWTSTSANTFYLKVMATPIGGTTEQLKYGRYTITIREKAIQIPGVIQLTGDPRTGKTNDKLKLGVALDSEVWDSTRRYHWTFGAGALPATSTSATPTITLLDAGTYTGNVVVSNSQGSAAPFAFDYTVTRGTPRISSVTPLATAGVGVPIAFSATSSNDPTSWSWDFGIDATPRYATEASPAVSFATAKTQTVRLTASNELGDSPTGVFNVAVTFAPEAARITAITLPPVCVGEPVTAVATIADNATVDEYIWQVPADVTITDSDTASPVLTFTKSGDYTIAVKARNEAGIGQGLTKSVAVEVAQPVRYARLPIHSYQTIFDKDLLVRADGRIAVAYYAREGSVNRLYLATSPTPTPTPETEWQIHAIDPLQNAGNGVSLIERNGRLAISYQEAKSPHLRVALANVPDPTSGSDWTRLAFDVGLTSGNLNQIHLIDDRLQIVSISGSMTSASATRSIRLARALTAWPTATTDWAFLTIPSSEQIGMEASSIVAQGRIAVIYTNNQKGLRLARATVAAPTDAAADWAFTTIQNSPMATNLSRVALIGDRLAFGTSMWDPYRVNVTVARVAEPAGPSDWTTSALSGSTSSSTMGLAQVNGRPVAARATGTRLLISYGMGAQPPTSPAWEEQVGMLAGDPVGRPMVISHNDRVWVLFGETSSSQGPGLAQLTIAAGQTAY